MKFPEHRKQRSIAQQVKNLLLGLLLILLVYMAGSAMILGKLQQQTVKEMDEMSKLYTNELDNRFLRISRKLFSTIMERMQDDSVFWNYVNLMLEDEGNIEYPVSKLRDLYLSSIWEYGQEYQLFLYLTEQDQYWHLTLTSDGGHTVSQEIQDAMKGQIQELQNYSYSVKKKWNIVDCCGENYMCKIAQNGNVSLGCFVPVKSILKPFGQITIGENGYVRLADESGKTVEMLTSKGIAQVEQEDIEKYSIRKTLSQAPFEIHIRVSTERVLEMMMGSVGVLCGIALILIGCSAYILLGLRRNLLAPVQQFVKNLENYGEEDCRFALTESNLLELEQIDDKFKYMIHQIRKLKITLYEQELEKQKMEMDYLKLQIRPHFYLNCLNFIYSMIDFRNYDCARRMIRTTAEYLSYIFRNVHELVPAASEMKHCENYLEILLLRYPGKFEYYLEVQEEVRDALIFPFLIQVFVENAAKQALMLPKKTLISVTVYPEDRKEGKYANIYISDTGNGFPDEILRKLKQGEQISENGQHLGIENCRKRFHYYYQDRGEINFDNSPLGGAIVDIHIPYEKGENYESAAVR